MLIALVISLHIKNLLPKILIHQTFKRAINMQKLFLCFAAISVFLVFSVSVSTNEMNHGISLSGAERELLQETNEQRKKKKLGEVNPNSILMSLARSYAKQLAEKNVLTHELNGQDLSKRIKKSGYVFRFVGENLAVGSYTPTEVVKAWMGSKPHRHNLLNSDFTEIGIGIYKNKNGQIFYCQIFGRPNVNKRIFLIEVSN